MVARQSTTGLSELCSADQLELLDSIDRLRQEGLDNYISLPQIIVCGDQSSGKSSVLEAISGIPFPVKSQLCTRFPTELVLRRTPYTSSRVSIISQEPQAYRGFHVEMKNFDELPAIIEKAKHAMGLGLDMHTGQAFSKDLLRVEVCGPTRPHLTIVDLPGLIHTETKHQSQSDINLIRELVQGYMEEPRSIILAVVSAKNDIANQLVLSLARHADKDLTRTLGVITKPDMLAPGSNSEQSFVTLAKNLDVPLRHGWHVLKNMDSDEATGGLAERDASEKEFFEQGAWTELQPSQLGIGELRTRLSKLLLRQIATELPTMMEEIERTTESCNNKLEMLGQPRSSLAEQMRCLFKLSKAFQSLVQSSVDGSYAGPFFRAATTTEGYRQRIRAVIQNLNMDFSSEISKRGHYQQIVLDPSNHQVPKGVIPITRDKFLENIQSLMKNTRGRELPGTFNPMVVADLFLQQSRPWGGIVSTHITKVWNAAHQFVDLIVAHIADDSNTAAALHREIFNPALKQILADLNEKMNEVLEPHKSGHPITYNADFTETVKRLRHKRIEKQDPDHIVRKYLSLSPEAELTSSVTLSSKFTYDLKGLVTALRESTEPDTEPFAAAQALDCLQAYYEVRTYTHLTTRFFP